MANIVYDFSGENYVVTGASSGIGRMIACLLVESGAHVLAIARREDKLRELQNEHPDCVHVAVLDVTDRDGLEHEIQAFALQYPISGTVHAAGINQLMPLRIFNSKEAQRMADIGLWAGIDLIKIASKRKYGQGGGGSHVLIASNAAQAARPGLTAYSAIKGAVLSASRSMALELSGRKIRVNTVSPGWVQTEMSEKMEVFQARTKEEILKEQPLGIGTTQDVAEMVLFLLSDAAKWVTGGDFVVDGGFLAGKM